MYNRLHFDFTSKDMALQWIALCFFVVLVHSKAVSATENNPDQSKNKAAVSDVFETFQTDFAGYQIS